MPGSQDDFQYQQSVLDALEITISSERLSKYLIASGHDKRRGLLLYLWNSRMQEAYHLPLQTVEVTLRNVINESLIEVFGPDWPNDGQFKASAQDEGVKAIGRVIARINRDGYPVTIGRIVGGLPFDFWASILSARFDRSLWQSTLRKKLPNFPGSLKRSDILKSVHEVKDLRNRVAHYEPIFDADHSVLHSQIIQLISFRCRETAEWVRHHSQVNAMLRLKP